MGTFVDTRGKTQAEIDAESVAAGTRDIFYDTEYSADEKNFIYNNLPVGMTTQDLTLPANDSIPDDEKNIIYLTKAREEISTFYRMLVARDRLPNTNAINMFDGVLLTQEKIARLMFVKAHDELLTSDTRSDYTHLEA